MWTCGSIGLGSVSLDLFQPKRSVTTAAAAAEIHPGKFYWSGKGTLKQKKVDKDVIDQKLKPDRTNRNVQRSVGRPIFDRCRCRCRRRRRRRRRSCLSRLVIEKTLKQLENLDETFFLPTPPKKVSRPISERIRSDSSETGFLINSLKVRRTKSSKSKWATEADTNFAKRENINYLKICQILWLTQTFFLLITNGPVKALGWKAAAGPDPMNKNSCDCDVTNFSFLIVWLFNFPS